MKTRVPTDEVEFGRLYQFPVLRSDGSTNDPAQVSANLLDMKLEAVEDGLEYIVPPLFDSLRQAGFSLNDDYTCLVLVAVLRGIMLQHFNINDPIVNFLSENKGLIERHIEDQLDEDDIGNTELP